jgi:hypothetical protein
MMRRFSLLFALVILLGCASAAYADSYQLTFTGGLTGTLDLTATPLGGGSFLVTSVSGHENGLAVTGMIAPNATGFYAMSDGNGFLYDDKLFPTSHPVFDTAGLLFTLGGPHGSIFENLYSVGSSSYLQSAYVSPGTPFPWDFSYVPVTFTLEKSPTVATPEPSRGALFLLGFLALVLVTFARKFVA